MSIGGNDGLFDVTKDIGLRELLEAQRDAEVQAERQAALIGDSDKVCTYDQGYINQSVYSCRTCRLAGDKGLDDGGSGRAGLCRGCAFNCHLSCEVDELFMKRSFRCDCGSAKFAGRTQPECTLCECSSNPSSSASPSSSSSTTSSSAARANVVNKDNKYSQNFDGLYCYCSKPYVSATDVMYQCTRCEDWFHDRCLVNKLPEGVEVELFCKKCVPFFAFLVPYSLDYLKRQNAGTEANEAASVAGEAEKGAEEAAGSSTVSNENDGKSVNGESTAAAKENVREGVSDSKSESEASDEPATKRQKLESGEALPTDNADSVSGNSADSQETSSSAASNGVLKRKLAKSSDNDDTAMQDVSTTVTKLNDASVSGQTTSSATSSSNNAASTSSSLASEDNSIDKGSSPETSVSETDSKSTPEDATVEKCTLKKLDEPPPSDLMQQEMYFEMGWRDELCRCPQCVKMFEEYDLGFMLEDEDEDEEDSEAVNYINTQMEDEAQAREQAEREQREREASTSSQNSSVPSSVAIPVPAAAGGGGAVSSSSNGAGGGSPSASAAASPDFSMEDLAFKALGKLPRAQVVQTISHFQVYSQAVRDGLRAWAVAHPGETVSREVMQGVTQEAKRVASEARQRGSM